MEANKFAFCGTRRGDVIFNSPFHATEIRVYLFTRPVNVRARLCFERITQLLIRINSDKTKTKKTKKQNEGSSSLMRTKHQFL